MNSRTHSNKTRRARVRFEPVTVRAAVRLLHEARRQGWHHHEVGAYIEALSALERGGQLGRGPLLYQLAQRRAGFGVSATPRARSLRRATAAQPARRTAHGAVR